MNGLVGAQNRGRGEPTEGKERKRIMKRCSKQRTGRANLRKREKMNGLVGAKTGVMAGQPKEKEKRNGLVDAKNRGQGGPTLGKKR